MSRARTPHFFRIIVTGLVLGMVVGGAWAMVSGTAQSYSRAADIGYFAMLGAGLGAILASLIAVGLDRRR